MQKLNSANSTQSLFFHFYLPSATFLLIRNYQSATYRLADTPCRYIADKSSASLPFNKVKTLLIIVI